MKLGYFALTALAAVMPIAVAAQSADPPAPNWDLPQQYPDSAAWNAAVSDVERRLPAFDRLRETPITSAAQLADLLDEARYLRGRAGNMARFALLTSAMDTRDDRAKARFDAATALEGRVESAVSWLDGATSALGRERLEAWRKTEPRLAHHGWELNSAILNADHSYPHGSEAAYAALERARLTATQTYDALMEADLNWPQIPNEQGAAVTVDPDSFGDLSTSRVSSVRRQSYDAFYKKLKALEPSLGTLLTRRLEIDHALATARRFGNGTDAFFGLSDGVPEGAYRKMIDSARANRAVLARYVLTVARLNGLSEVRYADLAVSAPDYPRPIPLEEAQQIAVDAAAAMGPSYQRTLKRRLAEPWFDFPAREHKGGGANGVYWGVGGGHPYGFISFRPNFAGARSISALAALTMFYTDLPADKAPVRREDDFPIYGNAIWFAGPLLEIDHLYDRASSREERIALLAGDLRRLWNVYFAGMIISDFEDRLEAQVAAGQPPTGAQTSQLYLKVLRDYYPDSGVRLADADGEEWMSLPNLFYGHVWDEWALAMAAAVAMNERVEAGDSATIAAIRAPMSRANSYSSYDMMRDAHADPTDPAMYQAVVRRMNADMDRIEAELAPAAIRK